MVTPMRDARSMMPRLRMLAALALAVLAAAPAAAQPVADFYRGKQIKLYIRAAPGGNYDVYSRLLGRHMVRFLPGNPGLLPVNMPGGGGLVALNYVANVAPRDGTVLTMITQSFPMDQVLGLNRTLKVDLRTLNWIGNMSDTNEFFYTSAASPTKTLQDARRRETPVAATGAGSIMTQLAALYNNMLGTRFKVIYGYPSGPDMTLAMERGEVEGRSTSNPQVLGASKAEVVAKYNFLIQTGMRKLPGCEEVPLLRDLAVDADQRVGVRFHLQGGGRRPPDRHQSRGAARARRRAARRLRCRHGGSGLHPRGAADGPRDQRHQRPGSGEDHRRHARHPAGGARQDRQGDRDQVDRARQRLKARRRGGVIGARQGPLPTSFIAAS